MRCRAGDLAIVIRAFNAVNIGRIVKVLRVDDCEAKLRVIGFGPVWIVSCKQPLRWLLPNGRHTEAVQGPVPDGCLQPLRGIPRNTNINDEEVFNDCA